MLHAIVQGDCHVAIAPRNIRRWNPMNGPMRIRPLSFRIVISRDSRLSLCASVVQDILGFELSDFFLTKTQNFAAYFIRMLP